MRPSPQTLDRSRRPNGKMTLQLQVPTEDEDKNGKTEVSSREECECEQRRPDGEEGRGFDGGGQAGQEATTGEYKIEGDVTSGKLEVRT